MPLDLTFRGQRELLAAAVDERRVATVDALLRDGAVVSIDPADASLPTTVLDLVERGLVTLARDTDPAAHAVVIQAALTSPHSLHRAPRYRGPAARLRTGTGYAR